MATHDDHNDELEWPDDDSVIPQDGNMPALPDSPEREDDASRLPVRHRPRRGQQQRRRSTYRPPSELDHE
jgi:hypothetical protein